MSVRLPLLTPRNATEWTDFCSILGNSGEFSVDANATAAAAFTGDERLLLRFAMANSTCMHGTVSVKQSRDEPEMQTLVVEFAVSSQDFSVSAAHYSNVTAQFIRSFSSIIDKFDSLTVEELEKIDVHCEQ